ncbi:MAG: phosphatase PAP2 family protein, partial [Opitutales bacterium]
MKSRLPLPPVLLTFVLALAVSLTAAPVSHDYLAEGAVNVSVLLPPPPDETSIAGQGEHEVVADLAIHRTPEQATLARYYEALDVFRMLAPVLGPGATEQNLPRTAAFFKKARHEARPAILSAKEAWNRQRPYVYNPALVPAVDRPNNNSYPSGHATDSALMAVLLTALLPEHGADWQEQAALVRWSRLVGGAHYPSDVMAGKLLGEAIGRAMLKS